MSKTHKLLLFSVVSIFTHTFFISPAFSSDDLGSHAKKRFKTSGSFTKDSSVSADQALFDEVWLRYSRRGVEDAQVVDSESEDGVADGGAIASVQSSLTPGAGFIPSGCQVASQLSDDLPMAESVSGCLRAMQTTILPTIEELLEHTWDGRVTAKLKAKDLADVVSRLKEGKLEEAINKAKRLVNAVNAIEKRGELVDEYSRICFYSIQTMLHLLTGSPYDALKYLLELRQLGILWYPTDFLKTRFGSNGSWYANLVSFVDSEDSSVSWGKDSRSKKLFEAHARFALDQKIHRERIILCLTDIVDEAGEEGDFTYKHTLYVFGKMCMNFGKDENIGGSDNHLRLAETSLEKLVGYRFSGLFSYRSAAVECFLGNVFWFMASTTEDISSSDQAPFLDRALDHYTNAIDLIEIENGLGVNHINYAFKNAQSLIRDYAGVLGYLISNPSYLDYNPVYNLPSNPLYLISKKSVRNKLALMRKRLEGFFEDVERMGVEKPTQRWKDVISAREIVRDEIGKIEDAEDSVQERVRLVDYDDSSSED